MWGRGFSSRAGGAVFGGGVHFRIHFQIRPGRPHFVSAPLEAEAAEFVLVCVRLREEHHAVSSPPTLLSVLTGPVLWSQVLLGGGVGRGMGLRFLICLYLSCSLRLTSPLLLLLLNSSVGAPH